MPLYAIIAFLFLHIVIYCDILYTVLMYRGAAQRQAAGYISVKEVMLMRITLHIGAFTVTIIVKRNRRHSAK